MANLVLITSEDVVGLEGAEEELRLLVGQHVSVGIAAAEGHVETRILLAAVGAKRATQRDMGQENARIELLWKGDEHGE